MSVSPVLLLYYYSSVFGRPKSYTHATLAHTCVRPVAAVVANLASYGRFVINVPGMWSYIYIYIYIYIGPHSCCTARATFFAERIINTWNSLPHDSIDFSSLHAFKRGIEKMTFLGFYVCISFFYYVPLVCSNLILLVFLEGNC